MSRQRILVTVKTYPTLSRKYGETVCTAGVREDGTWVRLYPVPFRRLHEQEQYKKFDWIECDLIKHDRDPRPESFMPKDHGQFVPVGRIGTGHGGWALRRQLLLERARVFTNMGELIEEAHANRRSLAVFKPSRVLDFVHKDDEREWNRDRIAQVQKLVEQGDLFDERHWQETFRLVDKIPYRFSYRFEDAAGKQSALQILDWEIGALYRNCLQQHAGNESLALEKVRQKYLDEFLSKDLHFFMGTTQAWHQRAPNPWVIVGVFTPPHESQMTLL